MQDLIERQAAIDTLADMYCKSDEDGYVWIIRSDAWARIEAIPSAQPEITDEQAIEHLQSTGWMQNHDREMYESGLREQLADDSGAYDSLVSCDDAISRQAAIDAIESAKTARTSNGEIYVAKLNAEMNIQILPSAQPEIIRCEECKHFHYDMPYVIQGVPVLWHEVCDAWGDGCKADENGYCFLAERRTDSDGRE